LTRAWGGCGGEQGAIGSQQKLDSTSGELSLLLDMRTPHGFADLNK
jgi:hypothetical protein